MKKPIINYVLEAKSKIASNRIKEELIIAMVHAGFYESKDGKTKYNRVKISLKASIKPKNFGLIENNFKFDSNVFDNYSKSNAGVKTKMSQLETKIDALYSNYVLNNIYPTAQQFKNDLLIQLGRKKRHVKTTVTILTYLNEKIKIFESLKNTGRKNEIDENSIKTYRTLATYIERYQLHKKFELTFDKFDDVMYWDLWDVLDLMLKGKIEVPSIEGKRKQVKKANGYLMSSIHKYQKTLLRILRFAIKDQISVALDITNENLLIEDKEASKDVYINENELLKIYNYQPTTNDMQIAKDYVILASLTGMRYESMVDAFGVNITRYSHDSYLFDYIHSKQNKTETECYIPLLAPVKEILSRYNNRFPKIPANQELNSDLKVLFSEVGINATSTITNYTYKSGVIIEQKGFDEIISSHDCRKSFVTNLLLSNATENIVMSVTHPDRKPKHKMAGVYNKANLLDKAKQFYDEVNRINKIRQSNLYRF